MTRQTTSDDADMTTIRVSKSLADALFDEKNRGESYEDVVWRLLEDGEG